MFVYFNKYTLTSNLEPFSRFKLGHNEFKHIDFMNTDR